jgi:hypothetical protein
MTVVHRKRRSVVTPLQGEVGKPGAGQSETGLAEEDQLVVMTRSVIDRPAAIRLYEHQQQASEHANQQSRQDETLLVVDSRKKKKT